jgi:hypothetical protein
MRAEKEYSVYSEAIITSVLQPHLAFKRRSHNLKESSLNALSQEDASEENEYCNGGRKACEETGEKILFFPVIRSVSFFPFGPSVRPLSCLHLTVSNSSNEEIRSTRRELTWKRILMRSRGEVMVREIPPAAAPATASTRAVVMEPGSLEAAVAGGDTIAGARFDAEIGGNAQNSGTEERKQKDEEEEDEEDEEEKKKKKKKKKTTKKRRRRRKET